MAVLSELLVAVRHHDSTASDSVLVLWPYSTSTLLTFSVSTMEWKKTSFKINKPDQHIPSAWPSYLRGCMIFLETYGVVFCGWIIAYPTLPFLWIEALFTKNRLFLPTGIVLQGWARWTIARKNAWLKQQHVLFLVSFYVSTLPILQNSIDKHFRSFCGSLSSFTFLRHNQDSNLGLLNARWLMLLSSKPLSHCTAK